MQIKLLCREECSACGACFTACPVTAIRMIEGADGFRYPEIDEGKCIRCGKCMRTCEGIHAAPKRAPMETYAAAGANDALVKRSASGGIFASLAREHIRSGGVAVGTVMEIDEGRVNVFHLASDSEADLARMQGSKYVQSDAWKSYGEVLEALRAGQRVLFSGTPCQVAAIRRLAGENENLITIDLICHGVPSLKMLSDYAAILSKRLRGRIEQIAFRDKSAGKSFCSRIDLVKGNQRCSVRIGAHYLSYYRYFLEGKTYRDSCYRCPYARMERVSDLTIGDYWGVEKYHGEEIRSGSMPKKSHWSCILVNTEKGKAFLSEHAGTLQLYPSKAEYVAATNQQLNAPSRKPEERDRLVKRYKEQGYSDIEQAFVRESGGKLRYLWRMYKNIRRNGGVRKPE